MAYGCQASCDHAIAKLERATALMAAMNKEDAERGPTQDRRLLFELASSIAYLADAVRYLKDGVP